MICLCVFLAAGCSREKSGSLKSKPQSHRREILIGLVPEQDIFKQVERYEPLARYLASQVGAGVDVKLMVVPRYEQIISNFLSQKMDAAFFGSFTYILAHAEIGVQAIARPVGLDGSSTYRGLIFVRKDSSIRSIQEMRGKRFAFVDQYTTAGYLLPLAYFKKEGVDYRTYLKESYFAGTHEDAIYDVLERKADIGAAKSTVFNRLKANDARVGKELMILAESPEVPENSLALRKDLDGSLKEKIKTALLTMQNSPEGAKILQEFGARRFIETTDGDFRPVYEYAREIGIPLRAPDNIR